MLSTFQMTSREGVSSVDGTFPLASLEGAQPAGRGMAVFSEASQGIVCFRKWHDRGH